MTTDTEQLAKLAEQLLELEAKATEAPFFATVYEGDIEWSIAIKSTNPNAKEWERHIIATGNWNADDAALFAAMRNGIRQLAQGFLDMKKEREEEREKVSAYAEAGHVIHLHLKEFCDERLTFCEMIAQAARTAGMMIESNRIQFEEFVEARTAAQQAQLKAAEEALKIMAAKHLDIMSGKASYRPTEHIEIIASALSGSVERSQLENILAGNDYDDPRLTRVAYVDMLVKEIRKNGEAFDLLSADDPDAFSECLNICSLLAEQGMSALAALATIQAKEPQPSRDPGVAD